MATVYKSVKGRQIQKWLAVQLFTQEALEAIAFEAAVKAEAELAVHKHEGHAFIDIEHGKVDWYVILNDTRGQLAALSIEYGRSPYIVEFEDGRTETRRGMDGLYILHNAFDLPKTKRGMVNMRRIKIRQGKGR